MLFQVFKELKKVELTALSSRSDKAVVAFLSFYVSHGTTARFVRGGKKYYIHIMQIIYCCFQHWKNFQYWSTVAEVIAKSL